MLFAGALAHILLSARLLQRIGPAAALSLESIRFPPAALARIGPVDSKAARSISSANSGYYLASYSGERIHRFIGILLFVSMRRAMFGEVRREAECSGRSPAWTSIENLQHSKVTTNLFRRLFGELAFVAAIKRNATRWVRVPAQSFKFLLLQDFKLGSNRAVYRRIIQKQRSLCPVRSSIFGLGPVNTFLVANNCLREGPEEWLRNSPLQTD